MLCRESLDVEWTTEVPTEPGLYWVSQDPALRGPDSDAVIPVKGWMLMTAQPRLVFSTRIWQGPGEYGKFGPAWVGVLWAKRKEPRDPWAK